MANNTTGLQGKFEWANSGYHNSKYRGKFLGNSVTSQQYEVIKNGSFDDLFIGDYWSINGVNYRIASFDYYLNCGEIPVTNHHVLLVTDTCLYNFQMNATNTTTGGYIGTKMYKEGLAQAKTIINNAFSGHVLSHKIFLTSVVDNGKPTSGAWCESTVELLCEEMVCGGAIFRPIADGTHVLSNHRLEKTQLPLFAYEPSKICNRSTWWLRDIVTSQFFSFVGDSGYIGYGVASESFGVRPYFCIY